MSNPVASILEQCHTGFPLGQKILIVSGCILYVICPLDLDFLPVVGWLDDGIALILAVRVLKSPTLTVCEGTSQGTQAASRARKQTDRPHQNLKDEVIR